MKKQWYLHLMIEVVKLHCFIFDGSDLAEMYVTNSSCDLLIIFICLRMFDYWLPYFRYDQILFKLYQA